MMKQIKQKVHLSIIGHQPCGHFAVQEWIDEEINKLPKDHELIEAHVQITLNPMTHEIEFDLYLESKTEDGNESLTRKCKTWKINYQDTEDFYRRMEKIS